MLELNKANTQEEIGLIQKLRYEVYCNEFNLIPKQSNHRDFDSFDAISDHYYIKNQKNEYVACVRVIHSSKTNNMFPFSIKNNAKNHIYNASEISGMVIREDYRKSKFLFSLLVVKSIDNIIRNNSKKIIVDTFSFVSGNLGCKKIMGKRKFDKFLNYYDKKFCEHSNVYCKEVSNILDEYNTKGKKLMHRSLVIDNCSG